MRPAGRPSRTRTRLARRRMPSTSAARPPLEKEWVRSRIIASAREMAADAAAIDIAQLRILLAAARRRARAAWVEMTGARRVGDAWHLAPDRGATRLIENGLWNGVEQRLRIRMQGAL